MNTTYIKIAIYTCLAGIISGCFDTDSAKSELCDKRIVDQCMSCSPYMERLRVVTNSLSPIMVTEAKRCVDLAAKLSVKDDSLGDVTLKGCIDNSKVLDQDAKKALIKTINEAQIPKEEYNVWLQCYRQITPNPVVIMDSHLKGVVYCKHTQDIGGSNAVDIGELIDDLPITPIPISTHLEWKDDQQVINLKPKLLILHASAFYAETKEMEGNTRLVNFLKSLRGTGIKILVYSRGLPSQPSEEVRTRWERILKAVNDKSLEGNAQIYVMPKGANNESCFADPDVGREFKNKVREMLGLL